MVGFVETTEISAGEDAIEKLTADNTVGLLRASRHQHLRGDVLYDVRRLRRAILAFEEHFDDRFAEIGIIDADTGSGPMLALTPRGGGHKAIVLAPRVHTNDDNDGPYHSDVEGLVTSDGGSA